MVCLRTVAIGRISLASLDKFRTFPTVVPPHIRHGPQCLFGIIPYGPEGCRESPESFYSWFWVYSYHNTGDENGKKNRIILHYIFPFLIHMYCYWQYHFRLMSLKLFYCKFCIIFIHTQIFSCIWNISNQKNWSANNSICIIGINMYVAILYVWQMIDSGMNRNGYHIIIGSFVSIHSQVCFTML